MVGLVSSVLPGSTTYQNSFLASANSTDAAATRLPATVAVQPSTQGRSTDNSGSDSGGTAERQSLQQQAAAYRSAERLSDGAGPSRVEPRSLIEARHFIDTLKQDGKDESQEDQALIQSIKTHLAEVEAGQRREREDPYAPPDPLPTADILKVAKPKPTPAVPAE